MPHVEYVESREVWFPLISLSVKTLSGMPIKIQVKKFGTPDDATKCLLIIEVTSCLSRRTFGTVEYISRYWIESVCIAFCLILELIAGWETKVTSVHIIYLVDRGRSVFAGLFYPSSRSKLLLTQRNSYVTSAAPAYAELLIHPIGCFKRLYPNIRCYVESVDVDWKYILSHGKDDVNTKISLT